MLGFVFKKFIQLVGTNLLKKIAVSVLEVVVARTDNTWDDDILRKIQEKGGI